MPIQTIQVPHLGGIIAAYQMPAPYDASKPTLVLINSFMTTSDLYRPQFGNSALASTANLIAIELLGHGSTRSPTKQFTYWDTAIMNLQVLGALRVPKFFVLGTSQGGWVAVRMALLAPEKVAGVLPVGSSMDFESERTRELGCWDIFPIGNALVEGWSSKAPTPEFEIDDGYCGMLIDLGLGKDCERELREFWIETVKMNYRGDDGRERARMACINLRDRDGLHGRVADVACPVLCLHGTDDVVYSAANAKEEIKLFINSSDARLKIIEGGQHFLSASKPTEVDKAVIAFLKEYS